MMRTTRNNVIKETYMGGMVRYKHTRLPINYIAYTLNDPYEENMALQLETAYAQVCVEHPEVEDHYYGVTVANFKAFDNDTATLDEDYFILRHVYYLD